MLSHPKRRKAFAKRTMLMLLLTICLTLFSGTHLTALESPVKAPTDFRGVAKKCIPAVVSIQVKSVAKAHSSIFGNNKESEQGDLNDFFGGDDFLYRFFGMPKKQGGGGISDIPSVGQASGFIVSADGYILTNSHVVQDATEITVTTDDNQEYVGKLIGHDPNTDVALIKIEGKDFPHLQLANSEDLEVGQWAIAIGTPLGLQATLTVGVVSAKGRNGLDLANIEDFIQTDAAINRGNSGGPLLDYDGNVMGMNTAIASSMSSGGYMGIGFAIPSNILKFVMDQLLQSGSVTRGFLGVTLQPMTKEFAEVFGVAKVEGGLIADVSKDSPADKAGLKQGDVIVKFNGLPVVNIGALRNHIALLPPGSRVTLTILRNNHTQDIQAEIGKFPTTEKPAASTATPAKENKLGIEVEDLTPDIAKSLGYTEEKGVVVTKVDPKGPAALVGLKKGSLIIAVNRKQVTSADQFITMLNETPKNLPVLLLVKQGDAVRFISIKVE